MLHLHPFGSISLGLLGLRQDDVVTVLLTSGNYYINGCVPLRLRSTVNGLGSSRKARKPSLNHEFGFPFEALAELERYGIPIIEDCAHWFFPE